MWRVWLQQHWQDIRAVMQKAGRFDFNILPLFKNPLFVASLGLTILFLFCVRLYRILSLVIAGVIFAVSWSYFIGIYGHPGAVPFGNWWIFISISIFLVAGLFYFWLVVLGD